MKKTREAAANNIIGARVRQARQRPSLQLSQVALSICLRNNGFSVCRTMVSKIESGERYVMDYELVGLAKCLHVTTAWLLGETKSYNKRHMRRMVVRAPRPPSLYHG